MVSSRLVTQGHVSCWHGCRLAPVVPTRCSGPHGAIGQRTGQLQDTEVMALINRGALQGGGSSALSNASVAAAGLDDTHHRHSNIGVDPVCWVLITHRRRAGGALIATMRRAVRLSSRPLGADAGLH